MADDGPLFLVVTIKPKLDRKAEAEAQLQSMRRHTLAEPGCVFMHLSVELDDQEGQARDALVLAQRWWLDAIAKAVSLAVSVGHFRRGTDPELFAFQMQGILNAYYHAKRLMRDPRAEERAHQAFDALVQSLATAANGEPASTHS